MASPPFPRGASDGRRETDQLDSPPPSTQLEQPGQPSSLADLVGPQQPPTPDQIPPEVLQGAMTSLDRTEQELSSLVQMLTPFIPDLGTDGLLVQLALQRFKGKLMLAGTPTADPTRAGPNFPGGGDVRPGPIMTP